MNNRSLYNGSVHVKTHRTCDWGMGFAGVHYALPIPIRQQKPGPNAVGQVNPWQSLLLNKVKVQQKGLHCQTETTFVPRDHYAC